MVINENYKTHAPNKIIGKAPFMKNVLTDFPDNIHVHSPFEVFHFQ